MFADLRALGEAGVIETDVCIVGAGAAGLATTLGLLDTSVQVLLLESGGLDLEPAIQDLYAGDSIGHDYYPLIACRLRCFGGTTSHWGGRSHTLAASDMAERAWIPHSGWPIGREDLEPHYRDGHRFLSLGPNAYGHDVWHAMGIRPPALAPERLEANFWRYSAVNRPELTAPEPVRLGIDYRATLHRARNVRVLLHGNVTKVALDPSGRSVQALEVRGLEAETATVKARRYVLACGGLETPRILLNSDDVHSRGVGNAGDLVGRFFMEHPDALAGVVKLARGSRLPEIFAARAHRDRFVRPGVRSSPALEARERVPASVAAFFLERDPAKPAVALDSLATDLGRGRWPADAAGKLGVALRETPALAGDVGALVTKGKLPRERTHRLQLAIEVEQAPNPDSRVTLSAKRDPLGQRRAQLDWRFTGLEKRSVLACATAVGVEVARLGLGQVHIDDWLLDPGPAWGGDMHGSYHHLGTTRMADDPRKGVVDRNCRVHGVDNLFIAGGSIFPTAGPSNPTLTIVALALRLADHLKSDLAPGSKAGLPDSALVFTGQDTGVPRAPPTNPL